jgi:thiol:disulfide interchange protein DsbD
MRIGRILLAGVAALGLAPFVGAQALSDAADGPHVHVQLVFPNGGIAVAGHKTEGGLYFKMESGWHVYWKNAGDSGEPPRMKWTLPDGITAEGLQFPAPKRLPLGPLMDFGYEDEVLFPFALDAAQTVKPGDTVASAKVNWLVCREVCIPGKAELGRKLVVLDHLLKDVPMPGPDTKLYERLAGKLPEALPASAKAVFAATPTGFRLAVLTGQKETEGSFFPADQGVVDNPAPQKASPVADGVVLELKKDANLSAAPAKLAGVIELSGGRAYEIEAVPGVVPVVVPVAGPTTKFGELARATGLAFLGGIILNLMPCVFPVLFLKGLALVNSSAHERKKIRGHGEVYATGIVVSFWVLVAALLGLRAAGANLGWGFQFQSPVFVALMAGLLFLMGLSLAGQFEIGLSLTSVGGKLAQKEGYAGSFFTGVLAVIVATPCTAPFMGAAVGYALQQSTLVTFAIFTALGLGLAAPYLVLCFQPAWTRLLPRPGAWMEILKQATAVPIFITVIWLVWVLAQTRGAMGVAAILGMFLLLAIAGWVLGRWPAKRVPTVVAVLVIAAGVAVAVYGVAKLASPVGAHTQQAQGSQWEPWSQAAVDRYRAEGRPVFVDFTASWCLSCQVNERVALRTDAVQAAFAAKNVALLKADWTEHDDGITGALAAMGRSGVPAYALYEPGTTASATLLPEVLTPGIVLDALGKLPQK